MNSKIISADETPTSALFSRIRLSKLRFLNKNLQNEARFARVASLLIHRATRLEAKRQMEIYDEFDNAVRKMHINSHLSVHTS